MNAETRAKEIARILRDAIVADANGKFEADDIGGRIWFTCDDSNAAVDCEVIAAAILPLITRAENDKLEEAAEAAEDCRVPNGTEPGEWAGGYVDGKNAAANAIRALKKD